MLGKTAAFSAGSIIGGTIGFAGGLVFVGIMMTADDPSNLISGKGLFSEQFKSGTKNFSNIILEVWRENKSKSKPYDKRNNAAKYGEMSDE